MPKGIYKNADRKCECWKCELRETCCMRDRYQRLPYETAKGALGLCPKLDQTTQAAKLGGKEE